MAALGNMAMLFSSIKAMSSRRRRANSFKLIFDAELIAE
jgi:hypothetical protein